MKTFMGFVLLFALVAVALGIPMPDGEATGSQGVDRQGRFFGWGGYGGWGYGGYGGWGYPYYYWG